MATQWFCGFGLEHVVPIYPIFYFEPCPLNANVARWWKGHSSSHLPVFEYTDLDHCGLMCLNDLHQTLKVTNVKTILLKTRKLFSCHAFSDGIVPIHGANVSGCLRPSIELRKEYVRNVQISPLGTTFFKCPWLHSLSSNDKTSICKLKQNWI